MSVWIANVCAVLAVIGAAWFLLRKLWPRHSGSAGKSCAACSSCGACATDKSAKNPLIKPEAPQIKNRAAGDGGVF